MTLPPDAATILQVERALLGGILNGVRPLALPVAAFSLAAHQLIYMSMRDLSDEGAAVDLVNVGQQLAKNGSLEDIPDGIAYLAQLADEGVPATSARCKSYQRQILESYCRREEECIGRRLADGEISGEEATDLIAELRVGSADQTAPLNLVNLADVALEDINWVWPQYIAAGKLHLIIGDPGEGKSLATIDIASRFTTMRTWPDGASAVPIGNVIMLNAEDGVADTIKPRVEAHGGDSSRITVITAAHGRKGDERHFSLDTDIPALKWAIDTTGAKMVQIDPLSAYLGKTNSWVDSEVRALLTPLKVLAEQTGVAIIGIMHLSKNQDRRVVAKALASIAFPAAARIVLGIGRDPENEDRRLVGIVKSNISKPPMLAFKIVPEGKALRLVWEKGAAEGVSMECVLSSRRGDPQALHDAKQFLERLFKDAGKVSARVIQEGAKKEGISESALNRAKEALGLQSKREHRLGRGKGKGAWFWVKAPPEPSPAAQASLDSSLKVLEPLSAADPIAGGQASKAPTLHSSQAMEGRDAEWLCLTEVIAPYRWTTAEQCELLEADPSLTPETLRLLMVACRVLDGEIWELRPRCKPAADHADAQESQRSTYVHPWPDALPELGPRTVCAFEPCADCGKNYSWAGYGGRVLCLGCALGREA